MNRRTLTALALVALLPIAGLVWIGFRLPAMERERAASRARTLLEGQAEEAKVTIRKFVDQIERQLENPNGAQPVAPAQQAMTPSRYSRTSQESSRAPQDMPQIAAGAQGAARDFDALIAQRFAYDTDGNLVEPNPAIPLANREREFIERTRDIWIAKDLLSTPANDGQKTKSSGARRGWFTWFGQRGLNFMYLDPEANGLIHGVELNRARFLAELIAALPDTQSTSPGPAKTRTRLLDEKGDVFYEWGAFAPPEDAKPALVTTLAEPFSAWKLAIFVPSTLLAPGAEQRWTLVASIAATGIAFLGLMLFLFREYTRDLREAGQRISFVNQVSHELKTPLTNVRMYAELLDNSVDESDEEGRKSLEIIVSESQRLSRLIENVLAFSKGAQGLLKPRPREGSLDAVVRLTLERFRPSLEDKRIVTEFAASGSEPFEFDPDMVEQILGNLIGNVEKYAAGGNWLRIETAQSDGHAMLRVCDKGPGIAARDAEAVFLPFHRLSDKLTDAAAGAGIGLTIARELARRQGGDLRCVERDGGACFELRLPMRKTGRG